MLKIKKFLSDECGATAIEYGLIAMLVSTAIVASATATGTAVGDLLQSVADAFEEAIS